MEDGSCIAVGFELAFLNLPFLLQQMSDWICKTKQKKTRILTDIDSWLLPL